MSDRIRLWLAGALVASAVSPAAALAQVVDYYHADGLGSVRVVTNAGGQAFERRDYLPFGEDWSPPANPQPRAFTGKERDGETGLDYFDARYYGSRIARFTSVDPLQVPAAFRDPQQWNRYSYARNNPLRFLDPTGRYVFDESVGPEQQQAFTTALNEARLAAGRLPGHERADVDDALDAYGTPGDARVTIFFRPLDAGGQTDPGKRPGTFAVVFNKDLLPAQLLIAVPHEGQHLVDAQKAGTSWQGHKDEVPAYVISALVAKGADWPYLRFEENGRTYEIWNPREGIRREEIERYVRESKHYRSSLLP